MRAIGSLLPAARNARSARSLANVAAHAEQLAGDYARLLADWPALVEWRRSEAERIRALARERAGNGAAR